MLNKLKCKTALIFAIAIAAVTSVAMPSRVASAYYGSKNDNITMDNCFVNGTLWRMNSVNNSWLNLPLAIAFANLSSDDKYASCQKRIDMKGDINITVRGPIILNPQSSSFVFSGGCDGLGDAKCEGKMTILNAKYFDKSYGNCVLTVNSNGATIRNIEVTNVPDEVDGICINGDDNTIDKVKVGHGKRGIVIEEGHKGNNIKASVSISNTKEAAIVMDNTLGDGNYIEMQSEDVGETDDNGFAEIKDGGTDIEISQVGSMFDIKGKYRILITGKDLIYGSGNSGAVSSVYLEGYVTDKDGDCPNSSSGGAKGIYVFSVSGQGKDGRLIGTIGSGLGMGLVPGDGTFTVRVPVGTNASMDAVVLVPYFSKGLIGTPSQIINVLDTSSGIDCAEQTLDGKLGGGNSGSGSSSSFGGSKRFKSLQDCCHMRYGGAAEMVCLQGHASTPGKLANGYDTDGDGTPTIRRIRTEIVRWMTAKPASMIPIAITMAYQITGEVKR